MQKANIADLKNNLSRYLRKVRSGETVLIMDRNRPIARIERVTDHEAADERRARLIAAGVLIPPKNPIGKKKLMEILSKKPVKAKKSVLEALIEERREGR
jgi:prevent-host-death family protein